VGNREGEELLCVGDLLGQGTVRVALALLSEGGLLQTGLPRLVLGPGSGESVGEGEREGWRGRKRVGAGPCAPVAP